MNNNIIPGNLETVRTYYINKMIIPEGNTLVIKKEKIINKKIEIRRIGYLAKIRKIEYAFWLNKLSFLCVKDKYACKRNINLL